MIWARGSAKGAAEAVCLAFHAVAGSLAAKRMELNTTKSGVVATPAKCAEHARRLMKRSRIPIVDSVRDLGLDTCWGRRRQKARNKRLQKQAAPAYRIACLPVEEHTRVNVASALLATSALYGVSAEGLSKGKEATLRTIIHAAIVPGSKGRRSRHADLTATGSPWRTDPGEKSVWEVLKGWRRNATDRFGAERLAEGWAAVAAKASAGVGGPRFFRASALKPSSSSVM